MMNTSVEGEDPAALYLMASVCPLRRRFSALLLVERAGRVPVVRYMLESARRRSPLAVVRKSREPNMMWLPGAKVSPSVNVEA